MDSLECFRHFDALRDIINQTEKYAKENNLEPLISFYLEKDLLKKLVDNLNSNFHDVYEKFKYNRDFFIKEVSKRFNSNRENNYTYFIYYAMPISEKTEIMIVKNNWIPPKAVILKGKVRLSFMPYKNIEELENAIKSHNEDDIVLEFENGIVKNYERRRNIFTDFRNVTEIIQSKNPVVLNLFTSLDSIFIFTIISNNVFPYKNKIEIINEGKEIKFNILEGKAKEDEVLRGDTLTIESKAEIYYDYRKKNIDTEVVCSGLVYKLPGF